jgi:hypothetical protein
LKHLTVDEIIALKIHGVTPEYIRQMRAAGLEANSRELVSLKIQEVTPEFVEKIRIRGIKDLTIHQIISLKLSGIS